MIIAWRVTEHCNLACPFCGYNRTEARTRREADPRQVEAFAAVLGAWQAATRDPVLLRFLGGEPLLWAPLETLEKDLRELCMLRLGLATNGTLLADPAVRARLLEHYFEVTVGVDGAGATHDRLRSCPGGFAGLRDGVRALADAKRRAGAGPRMQAHILLTRDSIDEFPGLCAQLCDWGIEAITFARLDGRERPEFHASHHVNEAAFASFTERLPEMRARLATAGVSLAGTEDSVGRPPDTAHERPPEAADTRRAAFLFVDAGGNLAPSEWAEPGISVPLQEVWTVAALESLLARFASPSAPRPRPASPRP
jgi:MoaA/NifB/PqqE/SkfB family radical SAM enzyme